MMRTVCLAVVLTCLMSAARSQEAPAGQMQDATREEQRLRRICQQLDLNAEVTQQVEALLAKYRADLAAYKADTVALLEKVRDIYAQVEAARAEGDTQRVQELQQAARDLSPSRRAENEFFEGLAQYLTDEQKTKLEQLRSGEQPPAQARPAAASTPLRAFHVLQALYAVNLDVEQLRQAEAVLKEYRQTLGSYRADDVAALAPKVESLISQLRGVLKAEQQATFDERIAALRAAPPAPKSMVVGAAASGPPMPPPRVTAPVRDSVPAPETPKAAESDEEPEQP